MVSFCNDCPVNCVSGFVRTLSCSFQVLLASVEYSVGLKSTSNSSGGFLSKFLIFSFANSISCLLTIECQVALSQPAIFLPVKSKHYRQYAYNQRVINTS